MKIMKKAMFSIAMLAGASAVSSANAADIYSRGSLKDGPAEYMPAITWTGFYFGGHLGATFFDEKGKSPKKECEQPPILTAAIDSKQKPRCESEAPALVDYDRRDSSHDLDDTSWLGGVHVGYNWQRSNGLVFGIEGDVSFSDDIDYLASLRGRLGYAVDRTLFYATGGVAFIGLDDAFGDDDTATGWVAGLGVEHKLRDSWSVGLEGLYYSFDDLDSFDDDLEFWTVRARLTYHFTDSHSEPLK